ncbi:sigma-54 interaction domain-containing protein [Gottfriedia acidiceleris]|uniref:sigma-54 interaction domain-containing protein n=1 Tax=Gottfriedia acidiceleris TaxID=371036 RepID=UPI000B451FD6|nr:sigma 54-interacting transcriptional regulator [Gottfriedia acidiceleris]
MSLTLITGSVKTKQALYSQLSHLLGDYISIKSFSIEEGIEFDLKDDIILYSSNEAKFESEKMVHMNAKYILVGKRTPNHNNLDKLLRINRETKVLVVNDDYNSTIELIQSLYQLGIDHLDYFPYKLDQVYYPDINIAISPGETHLCPHHINEVIDIGVRLFDMTTILQIVEHCHLDKTIASLISEKYIRNIIELQRKLIYAEHEAKKVNEHIQNVVDAVDDGILAIDKYSKITVFNDRLAALYQISTENAVGQKIDQVISQQKIKEFIINGKEESKFFTINNVDIVIYRFFIKEESKVVATFKSVNQAFEIEKTAQREFRNQGFYARYNFDDIIGEHQSILKCKTIAKKLALAEHPILIQGETGTGKELFAHSIHQHSFRKTGPFLAVNCSAFTESLLESELFGYEEGTFTGAKKGGKKGLFEMADGGTIFLDEIGDISLNVQSHLLRVLQEQEIRRIGGSKIIPINVRVIAATNKKIHQKILEGSFRSDLFYRLNVLSLFIPPLRSRRTDIPLLTKHFITKSGKWVPMENDVIEDLMLRDWLGNVRELKGVIDYMLTVCDGHIISKNDFPDNLISDLNQSTHLENMHMPTSVLDMKEHLIILEAIKQCNDLGKSASREFISNSSKESGIFLTTQQIRLRLDHLESEGFITKGRGRAGTKITTEGVDYLQFLMSRSIKSEQV